MAISSPDIGGLTGGMQAIAEGGAVSGALKSVEVAGPKLGGEIQAAFDGPGILGPDIGDFTKGLDAKLDVDPGAGIKDVANVNPNTPLSATLDGTSDSSISVDKSTIEPGGKTPSSATTEDTASSASSETPEPAAEPVAAVAPENADKAAKTQALEAKVADKTATAEDIKALRELKADPAQHRADLEQKALDGTITDAEADELGQLNTSETTSSQTPEQQAEELMKREGLGTSTEEGLAGLSTEQREQIQKAFEDMFKDVDKARKQDEERKREMKRLQREMQRLREQNKRLADQVKELNEKLDAAASEHAPEYKKAA